MSLKPSVLRDISNDSASMKRALGPVLHGALIHNPMARRYLFVARFPDGVVTGRDMHKALEKLGASSPVLAAGTYFTKEARKYASENGCDVVPISEF